MEGLRTPAEVVMRVIILLAYGCPTQAIVHAYGLDERTVADWQQRAGKHCQQVHQAMVEQGRVDAHHVQADEIRVKGCQMIAADGLGDRGFNALMDGRSREREAEIRPWPITCYNTFAPVAKP